MHENSHLQQWSREAGGRKHKGLPVATNYKFLCIYLIFICQSSDAYSIKISQHDLNRFKSKILMVQFLADWIFPAVKTQHISQIIKTELYSNFLY